MSTILITGAAGFTGVHACRHFQQRGLRVIAAVRAAPDAPLPADLVRPCDITDNASVLKLVQEAKPDYVLHLAGMNDVATSWRKPLDCMRINVSGTLHLLDALAGLQVKPAVLIVGSSLSFDPGSNPPQPAHPYALSKTIQALLARSWSHLFALRVMVAEPTNLIGPGSSAGLCGLLARYIARWEQGLTGQPFRLSSLTEQRDYLDVRDAVAAYEAILLHGDNGALYRFGSGNLRSIGDVVQMFQEIAGKSFPYVVDNAPPRDIDPVAPSPEPMSRLGWRPRIPFRHSIRDILKDADSRLTNHLEEGERS